MKLLKNVFQSVNGMSLIFMSFLVVAVAIIACSTDDENDNNDIGMISITEANTIAADGSWRITNYTDSGQDETSDFAGYTFTFGADGSLVATNGTDTLEGTWSVSDDSNSSDDDGDDDDDDIDFNIFFAVGDDNDFEDLNDDWDIETISETRIELRDISGGDGSVDILVFEKV